MRVLGIDPSPRRTGIALISFSKKIKPGQRISVISHRVVHTDKSDDLVVVIQRVFHVIKLFLRPFPSGYSFQYLEHGPIFIESPYFVHNHLSFGEQTGLFHSILVLLKELHQEHVQATPVNPNQVKTFLGIPYKERGNKDLVVEKVREMVGDAQFLEEKTKKDREAVCDAIGIACTGAFLNQ